MDNRDDGVTSNPPPRSELRLLAQSRAGRRLVGVWRILLGIAVAGTLALVPYAVAGWDVEALRVDPRAGVVAAALGILLMVVCAKVAGRRALIGLAGLLVGLGLMAFVIRPAIAAGVPAPVATLAVGLAITFLTLGLTYGRRAVAIAGAVAMSAGLLATTALAGLVVPWVAPGDALAIAGTVLATLGALCDVVVTQVSTVVVAARQKGRERLDGTAAKEVVQDSLQIGGDHLTSMIHTLGLAIVGPAVLSSGTTDISLDMLVTMIGALTIAGVTWLTTTLAVSAIRGLAARELAGIEVDEH